jgi:hypothetical protein
MAHDEFFPLAFEIGRCVQNLYFKPSYPCGDTARSLDLISVEGVQLIVE